MTSRLGGLTAPERVLSFVPFFFFCLQSGHSRVKLEPTQIKGQHWLSRSQAPAGSEASGTKALTASPDHSQAQRQARSASVLPRVRTWCAFKLSKTPRHACGNPGSAASGFAHFPPPSLEGLCKYMPTYPHPRHPLKNEIFFPLTLFMREREGKCTM